MKAVSENCYIFSLHAETSKMEKGTTASQKASTAPPRSHRPQPPEPIITEGILQLKELAQKQMKTDITIQSHLAKVKTFSQGTLYAEPTGGVTGQVSLECYKQLMQEAERLDELRHCGLTEDEIAIVSDSTTKQTSQKTKHCYGIDPLVTDGRLKVIEQKISTKAEELLKPTTFSGAKTVTRHEMELEHAVTRNRDPSKVFRCLLTEKSKDIVVDPEHPINHLDQIWKDVISDSSGRTFSRRKRKRKAVLDSDPITSDSCNTEQSVTDEQEASNPLTSSVWVPVSNDQTSESEGRTGRRRKRRRGKFRAQGVEENLSNNEATANNFEVVQPFIGPLNRNRCIFDTVSNVKDRELSNLQEQSQEINREVEPIPTDVIERYRLQVHEIKQLPRFKDYDPGEPSPTLYLKNLANQVTADDLAALFIHFQHSDAQPITIKLLRGRMRGQAFITFDSAVTASSALQLVNGYDFKGKPIIIEYGRKGSTGFSTTSNTSTETNPDLHNKKTTT